MTPSLGANFRIDFHDGVLVPASIRLMYAYETPHVDSWRSESPRSSRNRFTR